MLHLIAKLPSDEEKPPPLRKRNRINQDLLERGAVGSTITPSGSKDSKHSVSGHGYRKPRCLCAREGRRPNEIMYLLYGALWKEEQAWSKISRIVQEHVSDPLVAPRQDHDCDLDPREEAQVIDLTSLLN